MALNNQAHLLAPKAAIDLRLELDEPLASESAAPATEPPPPSRQGEERVRRTSKSGLVRFQGKRQEEVEAKDPAILVRLRSLAGEEH
jgi:hypothetical protein